MKFTDFFESGLFAKISWGLGLLIIILASFATGVFVGYGKAQFSYRLGQYYERNFGNGRPQVTNFLSSFGFTNANGAFGKIINASTSTLVISDSDNTEKIILLSSSTIIHNHHLSFTPDELRPNQTVLVIGSPNSQGQIEAELIRILN